MRRLALIAVAALALALPLKAEEIVADLSQSRVGITVNFDGSEIIVYGAVSRDAPAPEGPLDVIVTIEGPSTPVVVRRKSNVLGIWVNTDSVSIDHAPAFYAVASTRPLDEILSLSEDLRYRITLPQTVRTLGVAHDDDDSPDFREALIRLREKSGAYVLGDHQVQLTRNVLIRADVVLPANLTEGMFRARVFLLRGGHVVAQEETAIEVHKEGIERILHRLALDQPLIYGLLSLAVAIFAGWFASALFTWIRR